MQLIHIFASGKLMQTVNVLSYYCSDFALFLQLSKSLMTGIRLCILVYQLILIELIEVLRVPDLK